MTNKPNVPPPSLSSGPPSTKLENSTMRITSKTKVSTGSRKNTISKFLLFLTISITFYNNFILMYFCLFCCS